jgi:hypothetical protein
MIAKPVKDGTSRKPSFLGKTGMTHIRFGRPLSLVEADTIHTLL